MANCFLCSRNQTQLFLNLNMNNFAIVWAAALRADIFLRIFLIV